MNNPILDKLLDLLERKYGDLSNDSGCNIATDNGWRWMSLNSIVELIEKLDEEVVY